MELQIRAIGKEVLENARYSYSSLIWKPASVHLCMNNGNESFIHLHRGKTLKRRKMKKNLLIIHGGAPTAVVNASLYGVITYAKQFRFQGKILAAAGGTGGLLQERFIDLSNIPQNLLDLLPHTPGSVIGTSRDHLEDTDYVRMAKILDKYHIGSVLLTGGNGTMHTAGRLLDASKGSDVKVLGIPKTMDNDLRITDHSPGFGSAARFIAGSVREIAQDVKSLPIHVVCIETLGRNAGWVTAASALARVHEGDAPHMILCPEVPFEEDRFLEIVEDLYRRIGGVVVVASEGLKDIKGNPIVKPIFQQGRSIYFGDVSSHLARLVTQKLGIKARSEKPGILGRASIAWQSQVDREESIVAGKTACQAILDQESGSMIGFKRIHTSPYAITTMLIPFEEVMLAEQNLPLSFLSDSGIDVRPQFCEWCKPLTGSQLGAFCESESLPFFTA